MSSDAQVSLGPGPVIIDPFKIYFSNKTSKTFPLVSESVTSTPTGDVTVDDKPGHELKPEGIAVLAWRFNGDDTSKLFNFPGTIGTVEYKLAEFEASTTTLGIRIVVEPFAGVPPVGSQLSHFEYEILTGGGVEQPSNPWITPASGALRPFTFTVTPDSSPSYSVTVTPSTNDQGGYELQVVLDESIVPVPEATSPST